MVDLVKSFNKLILDASGDTATLDKFSELLSEELERVSNNSTKSKKDSLIPSDSVGVKQIRIIH